MYNTIYLINLLNKSYHCDKMLTGRTCMLGSKEKSLEYSIVHIASCY